jgi:hypothetical protein
LAALHLIEPHADRSQKVTLGDDKGFDTQEFVAELREINVTPHVAQHSNGRRPAIDGRTTRHAGRPRWAGNSPWPWRLPIWFDCRSCWWWQQDAPNPSRAYRQGQKITEHGYAQAQAALKTC